MNEHLSVPTIWHANCVDTISGNTLPLGFALFIEKSGDRIFVGRQATGAEERFIPASGERSQAGGAEGGDIGSRLPAPAQGGMPGNRTGEVIL